jgi:phosphoribosyl-AMP cyclohydrolase
VTDCIDDVAFNEDGLVPVVAQDHETGRVLMLAWANEEALREAAATGRGVYFSRSRKRLWRKGEESGNVQKLHEIRLDCDGDAVLYVVTQVGGMACHTGRESCFYRRLEEDGWRVTDPVIVSPETLYGSH